MNNIPAFPTIKNVMHPTTFKSTPVMQEGMTLLDYFAAKAMQGIVANNWNEITCSDEKLAEDCYKLASAMLEARNHYIK